MDKLKSKIFLDSTAKKIYLSLMLLIVVFASVTGVTYAYLSSISQAPANVFTAGTVGVELLSPENGDPSYQEQEQAIIEDLNGCKKYTWTLKNSGTKTSFLRAKVTGETITIDGGSDSAWAYGGNTDGVEAIELKSIENVSSERWGWTNRIDNPEEHQSYTLELYAGAGGNDLSKGTLVGDVIVNILSANETSTADQVYKTEYEVEITYSLNNDYPFSEGSEANFWVGEEKLNPGASGNPAAPGQLGFKADIDEPGRMSASKTVTIESESGVIHIAAHGTVDNTKEDQEYNPVIPPVLGDECENNWFFHEEDGYLYYWDSENDTLAKFRDEVVTLCLVVCPPDGNELDSYDFEIKFETVQVSNCAIDEMWPGHPLEPFCD